MNTVTIRRNLLNLIMVIMGCYVLIPFNLRNGITIIAGLTVLIFFKKAIKAVTLIDLIVFLSFFFFTLLKINNDNILELFRLSPLLIYPLFFSIFKQESNQNLKKGLALFAQVIFISTNVFLMGFITYFLALGYRGNNFVFNFPEMMNSGIGSFSFHPIYISILLCISIVLGFEVLQNEKNKWKKRAIQLGIVFLLINIIFLSRKAFLFFIVSYLIYVSLIKRKATFFTIGISFSFICGIIFISPVSERFLDLYAGFINEPSGFTGSTYVRQQIYNCTLGLIKESPIFGYGLSESSLIMEECLQGKNISFHNTHNQFLGMWLSTGFFGFMCLTLFFIKLFFESYPLKNKEAFIISLLLFTSLIFENLFDRQDGLIIFSLFVGYINLKNQLDKQNKTILIGPLPNPVTGLSIANELALSTLNPTGKPLLSINTSPKHFSEKLGRFNLISLLHFTLNYLEIYKIFFVSKVYYTPGQTFFGVLKYAPFVLFSKFLGKEIIVHIHGNYVAKQYQKLDGLKKRIFRKILSYSDKGIVLSKTLHDNLSPFIAKENVFVLPNFYNKQLTEQLVEKSFSELKICYLSNLMNEKGIYVLLEALEELNAKGISFKATIAGHIEQSQENTLLHKMAQIEGLIYKGLVRGEEKSQMLQEANVFVLPTFYKMEGLPISIIEAMATGNVIITTDHGAIPDLVTESENGFLIKKKSADAIVEKLLFLAENPSKAKEISNNNILKAKSSFTSEKFSEKLLNILYA